MINVPNTYYEWMEVLNILKARENDASVLQAMQKGAIELQSGVAERFVKKLMEAVNCRMDGASDRFQKAIKRSSGAESEIVEALLALRKEFSFLCSVVGIPALQNKYSSQLVSLIRERADEVQESLEESAKADRSGKMSSIVKNNRVNSF